MIKTIFVSFVACLFLLGFAGCYRPEDVIGMSSVSEDDDPSDTTAPFADGEKTTEPTTVTTLTTTQSQTATTTTVKTTATTVPAYDKNLARDFINFNYDYKIVKGLVEGTLSKADLKKLKAEIPYYNNISSTSRRSPDFDINQPGVIGDDAAIEKAREYINVIFGYEMPDNIMPDIIRYNFLDSASNEYLKWDTYYGVYFSQKNLSSDIGELFYGINIDAKSGKCIGGNFLKSAKSSENIVCKNPDDKLIGSMQKRAKTFVESKKLVPGSKCVYVFSELTALKLDGGSSELQTEVYLDNGYIIDIHEGFREGNRLYFNIFRSHGFKG